MSKPDLMALAEEERTDLLALLQGLNPAQWQATTLCAEWSVREVATHIVSYDELSKPALAGTFLKGRGSIAKTNDVALRRYDDLDPGGVSDLVARNLRPRGLTSGFGGGIALTDGAIHQQDIRRALDLPRAIPEDRLRSVLNFALSAPTLPAKKNTKGLKLLATDIDWASGSGDEVSGPGEALLMAIAGRPQALAQLSGPGLATLRTRVR